jgi:1-acyl-sn-glycerol-3-phosphate acyltransferase
VVETAQVQLDIRGREHIPVGQAVVLMSDHQSHLDIPILFVSFGGRLRMVAKRELFRIPLFGPAMRRAGIVEVDRSGDRDRARAAMSNAAEAMAAGTSIWIAPEGTRSADGRLGTFKKGGFLLAKQARAPILPVAIDGSRHILPKHARSMQAGVPVKVTFGVPIAPEGPVDALMAAVRAHLEANVSDAV